MEGQWIGKGIWKERARALRFQIRDRFRVAVDRHRHWPTFSKTFVDQHQRWFHLVRYFLGDRSHPSPFSTNAYVVPRSHGSFSSRFYRKKGKFSGFFSSPFFFIWCWFCWLLEGSDFGLCQINDFWKFRYLSS